MAQAYETLERPGAPLSQQMDGAQAPVPDASFSSDFDPICNLYAYNGDEGHCLYDICCCPCTYADGRIIDEVLQNMPDSRQTQAGAMLSAGQHTVPRRCLPGCTKHFCFVSIGFLPWLVGSCFGCLGPAYGCLDNSFYVFGAAWATVVGGRNRQRLKDKYGIRQPECSVLGYSYGPCEPYCTWAWCPLVCAQEVRFLRRKFDATSETNL